LKKSANDAHSSKYNCSTNLVARFCSGVGVSPLGTSKRQDAKLAAWNSANVLHKCRNGLSAARSCRAFWREDAEHGPGVGVATSSSSAKTRFGDGSGWLENLLTTLPSTQRRPFSSLPLGWSRSGMAAPFLCSAHKWVFSSSRCCCSELTHSTEDYPARHPTKRVVLCCFQPLCKSNKPICPHLESQLWRCRRHRFGSIS